MRELAYCYHGLDWDYETAFFERLTERKKAMKIEELKRLRREALANARVAKRYYGESPWEWRKGLPEELLELPDHELDAIESIVWKPSHPADR